MSVERVAGVVITVLLIVILIAVLVHLGLL